MNRSQTNTSSSPSGGFIYFNPKFLNKSHTDQDAFQHSNNSSDTKDFLAFDNSPVQNLSPRTHHGFSPTNFSSPKFNQRHHHSHASPYRYSNKSPRGRGLHHNYSGNLSYHGPNRFSNIMTPNNSRNFGYNQNRSWQKSHSEKNENSAQTQGNMSIFYDHTCLQNPWLDLERQLEQKTGQQKEVDSNSVQKTEEKTQNSGDSESDISDEEGSSSEINEES